MVFFIAFILGAVMLGAGSMLAPAWPTAQPRIGTAAAFALALVVGGSVFWAHLFGWSTLVVDYLLFALVSIVILGGTMAQAQHHGNDNEIEVDDNDVGWTGPEDLTFFALVAILFCVPLFVWVFPRGDHAAANALITLAARDGGSFDSLAPFYPDTIGLFPPGFHALAAYLSAQLGQPIPQIHMAIGAVTGLLAVWGAYDFGSEIQDKRLGRAMAIALLLGFGFLQMYFDSYYPQMMGVVFAFAFATYAVRAVRHHLLVDMVAAGLMLGAVLIVSPMMCLPVIIAYLLYLAANYLPKRIEKGKPEPDTPPLAHVGRWLLVPLVAVIATLPWLIHAWGVLKILMQHPVYWELDFLSPSTLMIPASIPLGFMLLWIFERLPKQTRTMLRETIHFQAIIALVVILVILPALLRMQQDSRQYTQADLATMEWLMENAPDDARVLNHPTDGWFMPTTGIDSISVALPDRTRTLQGRFGELSPSQFWRSGNESLLRTFEIDYIIVPQWIKHALIPVGVPDIDVTALEKNLGNMPFLEVVFEQDGAVVYRVIESE